jgi:two-component system NtrC family response regulator
MGTILVVDDEPIVLKLCQAILQRGGYSVLSGSGGDEGLRLLRTNGFGTIELALLDVMMPGMNGIELADRIRAANPDVPIVLMSGFGPKEVARVVGDKNPYRIIWKPFKSESLLQMVENAIGQCAGQLAIPPDSFGHSA